MKELAYVNGVYCSIEEATISIEDRGFQFGDSLYEVVHTYGGQGLLWPEHLNRLRRGLEVIGLDYDFQKHPLGPIIAEGLRLSGIADARVYLQITRGVAPRIHEVPDGVRPTVVMTFKPATPIPEEMLRNGVKVVTTPDIRWAHCFVKATTLLPNVLAKTAALKQGCYDAIFITDSGEVRECTSANVFLAKDGKLFLPPRTKSVLHGITQLFLIECAQAIELPCVEETIQIDALRSADEVFMSSTGVDILGITTIDSQPVGKGIVGPITKRLHEEYIKRIPTKLTNLNN